LDLIAPGAPAWRSALMRGTFWTISGSLTNTTKLQQFGFRSDLPHLGDYDFLLRALMRECFLYYERPLCEIRFHGGQASAMHLASCRDLRERLQVISEQAGANANHLDFKFRLSLMCKVARSIAGRGLGALRHMRWKQTAVCTTLLPL